MLIVGAINDRQWSIIRRQRVNVAISNQCVVWAWASDSVTSFNSSATLLSSRCQWQVMIVNDANWRDGCSIRSWLTDVRVDELRRRYACFNTILELSCLGADDLLMFEKARYGRNDTLGSVRCRVPYDSFCEIDVQHSLNTACGGKPRCSLAVNTAVFDDPCGYDEFLYVNYRCLSGTAPSHRLTFR